MIRYMVNIGHALYDFGDGVSVLLNALLGGKRGEPLSLRIGRSILRGGPASRVPMPGWLRGHFIRVAKRAVSR
jgi:hypothetical protein